jgi:hypothetical protein
MSFETPEALATELVTFVDNDGDLYRGQTLSIIKNLVAKKASGKYDSDKSVALWMYLAESGAKKYAKEFGSAESAWHEMFPIDVRRLAATHWRDSFEDEVKTGAYDDFIPKKYQKKTTARSSSKKPKKIDTYQEGAGLAQRAASNLSRTEIMSIVRQKHVYGTGNLKLGPQAERGYLARMRAILDAMDGN